VAVAQVSVNPMLSKTVIEPTVTAFAPEDMVW